MLMHSQPRRVPSSRGSFHKSYLGIVASSEDRYWRSWPIALRHLSHGVVLTTAMRDTIEIDTPDLSARPPSRDSNPHNPAVKVVAFAYDGARSQQLHAIGKTSFRCPMWVPAVISTYGILRLMGHGIGAGSS